jgi:hypothetical protein
MRIRFRLPRLPPLSFANFRTYWKAEMRLSRFVAMMGGAGDGEVEKA